MFYYMIEKYHAFRLAEKTRVFEVNIMILLYVTYLRSTIFTKTGGGEGS